MDDIGDDDISRALAQGSDGEFEDAVAGTDVDEMLGASGNQHGEVAPSEKSPYQNDWDAELQRISESRVVPGHGPVGDLDAEIRQRELLRQEQQKTGLQVRVNPPSAIGAIMGAQAVLTAGNTSDWLVWWSGGDDTEAIDVTICIVNLGSTGGLTWPQPTKSALNPFAYRPYANVRWGTRAFMTTARVDVGRGCQMVVSASAVYVQLGMDAPPATGPQPATTYQSGTMTLAAMLSFKARQSVQPLFQTAFIDQLANGASTTIVVPTHAQQVSGFFRDNEAITVTLRFQDTNSQTLYSVSVAANANLTDPIPIGDDVYQVVVANTGASTINARLMFGMCL